MMHDVKMTPEFFHAIRAGKMNFALVLNENYIPGDMVTFREFDPRGSGKFTGEAETRKIATMVDGSNFMPGVLSPRYAILGLEAPLPLVENSNVGNFAPNAQRSHAIEQHGSDDISAPVAADGAGGSEHENSATTAQ